MSNIKWKKYGLVACVYIILSILFLWVGGEQLRKLDLQETKTSEKGVIPEFIAGQKLVQPFSVDMDSLEEIEFMVATYARANKGNLHLTIETLDGEQKVLAEKDVDVSGLEDNSYYIWRFDETLSDIKGKKLALGIESQCQPGEAITLYYGDIENGQSALILNGQEFSGELHLVLAGADYSLFGMYYWLWVAAAGIILILYIAWSDYQESKGKLTKGKLISVIWHKYKFLIEQLVARDFKTKYKRSVLGYLWSFLNPLLTMIVQYVVFSTIFKSGIENYPVYLLSGIILFNFFSEAIGQGLGSIVYNASLITKVYVPKYIYPVTKVASTSINLFISIIPLLLAVVITGVKITPSILLLPFILGCLLVFCVGMVLMLSAAMVFFRDTQYLWGIISMVWMYATPIFYPEDIIPAHFRFIQTLNPMYYMVKFARTILIDGVSPNPGLYGTCILSAVITCVIGAIIFKKTQNKFVLYI